jgi:SAM-dependent methyltransferase
MSKSRQNSYPSDFAYIGFAKEFGPDDPRASGYRSVRHFEFEATLIRDLLSGESGRLLDLACGHGLITAPLVKKGVTVFGLDYNGAATQSAANRGLIVARGDAFSMPIMDASFDVVVTTEFLQQFRPASIPLLVSEIARVTKTGGHVILVWRNGSSLIRRLLTPTLRFSDRLKGRPPLELFNHTLKSVERWAADDQLKLIETMSLSTVLRQSSRNVKSILSRLFGTSYIARFQKQ